MFSGVSMLTIFLIAADECRQCFNREKTIKEPAQTLTKTFWAYGRNIDGGHLKEVYTILQRMGYQRSEDPGNIIFNV